MIAFGGHGSDVATVTTQDDITGSRSGESGLCTGANHQGLMLSDCSQYMNREPVCLGEVNGNELDTGLLTSLQQRLVKTGGRLVKHARYYWLMLAEGHLTRTRFTAMMRRIALLPLPAN
jgi:hypothetical protein